MSARYTSNIPQVTSENVQKLSVALRYMTDAVVEEAHPNTPKDKDRLRKDIVKQVLGLHGEIHWLKEYAGAQEAGTTRGYPIKNYTTPGTGPHYAENAVKKVAKDSDVYLRKAGL